VHHIIPLEDDPERGLELDNLMCLCEACHNKQHPEKGGAAPISATSVNLLRGVRVIKI
jgi:5-methylcytosine-specific restriction endonuclease McrA